MSEFSNSIRELRQVYGQSQQAFATMLGLSIASIAHYETDHRYPGIRITIKFIHAARMKQRKDLIEVFRRRLLNELSAEEIASLKHL